MACVVLPANASARRVMGITPGGSTWGRTGGGSSEPAHRTQRAVPAALTTPQRGQVIV